MKWTGPGPSLVGGQLPGLPRWPPPPGTGPSRLTSTAVSRGESKLTAAAEWMTMSHSDSRLQALVVEAQPVGGHVAGHRRYPGGHLGLEPVAVLLPEAVEAVVLQDLLGGPLHRASTAGPGG